MAGSDFQNLNSNEREIVWLVLQQTRRAEFDAYHRLKKLVELQLFQTLSKMGQSDQNTLNEILLQSLAVFFQKVRNNTFRGESSITTFIIGIAKNIWKDLLTKHKRQEEIKSSLDEGQDSSQVNPNEITEKGLIEKYKQHLSPSYLHVLTEYYLNNKTTTEIALELKRIFESFDTVRERVKKHLQRGRTQLKKVHKQFGEND